MEVSLYMTRDITDKELLDAIQVKLDARGPTFSFAIRAMIHQYMPEESSDDARKIPQQKRAAFLERLRNL